MKKITYELIKKFNNYLVEEEKSDCTLEKYIRDLKAFMNWMQNNEITKLKILEYKKYLMENYAPTSVNSMLSSLNSFFDFNGWYEFKVKTLKIQRQVFADKNKELSKTEYERLLKAAELKKNKQLYYLIQTICGCGLRVSELKYIDVNAVKNGKATINCKGKIRVVMIPNELCKILKKFCKDRNITQGSVFVTKNGNPLNRSNIWRMLKNLCKIAGVSKDKVFPHNLRHLFARTYYSVRKDIVRLADILGHTSINTTRIYTMESYETHRNHIHELGLLRC